MVFVSLAGSGFERLDFAVAPLFVRPSVDCLLKDKFVKNAAFFLIYRR